LLRLLERDERAKDEEAEQRECYDMQCDREQHAPKEWARTAQFARTYLNLAEGQRYEHSHAMRLYLTLWHWEEA
jgi:hypothetical protein